MGIALKKMEVEAIQKINKFKRRGI